jgi:hypothetical protein
VSNRDRELSPELEESLKAHDLEISSAMALGDDERLYWAWRKKLDAIPAGLCLEGDKLRTAALREALRTASKLTRSYVQAAYLLALIHIRTSSSDVQEGITWDGFVEVVKQAAFSENQPDPFGTPLLEKASCTITPTGAVYLLTFSRLTREVSSEVYWRELERAGWSNRPGAGGRVERGAIWE